MSICVTLMIHSGLLVMYNKTNVTNIQRDHVAQVQVAANAFPPGPLDHSAGPDRP
jgi:hypothetical protein